MENLKLPVALVAAMAVQLAAGVWWVSQQAATIARLRRDRKPDRVQDGD